MYFHPVSAMAQGTSTKLQGAAWQAVSFLYGCRLLVVFLPTISFRRQKPTFFFFLVENLEGGGRRDSGRFRVSELSQAHLVCSNQKIEILLQLKCGFSNTVPGAESLCSKIFFEEKENINLRLDTPPLRREKKKSLCARALENLDV